jgi:hypothetical protein
MKKLLFPLAFLSLIVFTSSCKKFDPVPDNAITTTGVTNSIENNTFSPDFDWATTRVINLTIICPKGKLINITSIDGKVRYNRGINVGTENYKVKLSIPKVVKQLKINDQVVALDSKNINFTIS